MTPFASVAMLEKLALLKIARCEGARFQQHLFGLLAQGRVADNVGYADRGVRSHRHGVTSDTDTLNSFDDLERAVCSAAHASSVGHTYDGEQTSDAPPDTLISLIS
jgi:hypothetical protein